MANLNFTVDGNNIEVTLGSGGGFSYKRDKFTTDNILTSFTLSYTPNAQSLLVFWNGILQEYGVDYTLSGAVITPASLLDVGKLEALYAYSA